MKIELGCKPSPHDQDDFDRCAKADESQERVTDRHALACKDNTPGGAFMVQRDFRVSVKEVLKENAITSRRRALHQALYQGMWQAKHPFQKHQQAAQPQKATAVRWERFLPQQQLQVLLVEDDDATRHIASALLRKCSYEVTSASNGLLAWQLLMDQTTSVDLVLTEVVMPSLSGIGLLGRIMSHESLKHIPVIMMSSHDSMNVVFKCLSKGAVDFLVKPVRKNELKNLWQHVWRRSHSSCASRSGCGSQTQKTSKPHVATNLSKSDSGTSADSEKTSGELNVRGGSDDGSGTQSQWNKGALEVESSPESDKLDTIGFNTSLGTQPATKVEDNSLKPMHSAEKANAAYLHLVASTKQNPEAAAKLIGSIKERDSNQERKVDDDDLFENHASNSPCSKDKFSDCSSPASDSSNNLDLSLKRFCEEEDHTREKGGGGGVIHSYVSAVSRYNARENTKTTPANANVIELVGFRDGIPAKGACNGIELESSAVFAFPKENVAFPSGGSDDVTVRTLLEVDTEAECLLHCHPAAKYGVQSREEPTLPPVPCSFPMNKHAGTCAASPPVGESTESKDCFESYKQAEFAHSHNNGYSQYHHHSHHHHHHHHIQHHYYHVAEDKLLSRPKTPQYDDQTVTEVRNKAPRCGSSNMQNGGKGNLGLSASSNGYESNCFQAVSVNRSATGSNNGSNGDQSAAAILPIGGNKDVNKPVEGDKSLLDVDQAMGANENLTAIQEATLTKFKLKRKERSFERKVGHQSRKRWT